MARSSEYNDRIREELMNKETRDYTKEDAKAALNLFQSTGELDDKILESRIKHRARYNADLPK